MFSNALYQTSTDGSAPLSKIATRAKMEIAGSTMQYRYHQQMTLYLVPPDIHEQMVKPWFHYHVAL